MSSLSSHEAATGQEGLFPIDIIPANERGLTEGELAAKALHISAVAGSRPALPDEPTATDRYIEEIGGGTRTTLAVNPPYTSTRHTSHRGGRSYPERSGRDIGLEIDSQNQTPRTGTSATARQEKEAAAAAALLGSAKRDAGGDKKQEIVLGLARMQRR